MVRIGIIGTGNMGSMLARKLLEAEIVSADMVLVYNHTPEKMNFLVKSTGVRFAKSNCALVEESDLIFICVRPDDFLPLILEIKQFLTEEKTIISFVSDISIQKIKEWSGHDAVRVIPSVTSECRCGISVISFGKSISHSIQKQITLLFNSISVPYVTDEENMSFLSDITSSSPAIIAAIIREYVRSSVRRGHVSESDAELLLTETLTGTALPLSEKKFSLDSLIDKVSTKGGITAEGVNIIEEKSPALFEEVLLKMSEKHNNIQKINLNKNEE